MDKLLVFGGGWLIYICVTDEVRQTFVLGRSCELHNIVIYTVAAGVGVGMVMLIRRWWFKKKLNI